MTMTHEVATVQSFQERVGSMIRAQIGELMTNEEIKALVDKAMTGSTTTVRTALKIADGRRVFSKFATAA